MLVVNVHRDGALIGQAELATALRTHGVVCSDADSGLDEAANLASHCYAIATVLCDLWDYTCLDGVVLTRADSNAQPEHHHTGAIK